MKKPIAERFWSKVDRSGGPDACWPWTASRTCHGYGRIGVNGVVQKAYRVAWELTHGPIPEGDGYHGTCVMHRCDNPPCVNPAHLRLGTHAENCADSAEKGRAWNPTAEANKAKTHCIAGHRLDAGGSYVDSHGWRKCRTCVAERMRRYYQQNREAIKARIYSRRA